MSDGESKAQKGFGEFSSDISEIPVVGQVFGLIDSLVNLIHPPKPPPVAESIFQAGV